jgi:lipoyl(octanoyl) transferase
MPPTTIIRKLDLVEYQPTYEAMQQFTAQRHSQTNDEIWLLQHPPVFTLGRNTLPEHLTPQSEISVIPIDRGGQITYHGPGQLVVYLLLDLKRLKMGVRELVHNVERSIISVLGLYAIDAYRK